MWTNLPYIQAAFIWQIYELSAEKCELLNNCNPRGSADAGRTNRMNDAQIWYRWRELYPIVFVQTSKNEIKLRYTDHNKFMVCIQHFFSFLFAVCVSFELTKMIYWKWCDLFSELCGSKVCYCSCCWRFALVSVVGWDFTMYYAKDNNIFFISFNSHSISFRSSSFHLKCAAKIQKKDQINYSLALPVSQTHLVNIIFFRFVAFTSCGQPSVEYRIRQTSWFVSEVFSYVQNQIFVCANTIKIAFDSTLWNF